MSDARAKAEARRAKILARESSMKVQAIGDDLTLPVDGKPQERPLAKRRTYVKSVAEKAEESTTPSTTPQKVDKVDEETKPDNTTTDDDEMPALMKIDENPNTDDPDVDSIADHSEKHHSASPSPTPVAKSVESNNEKKNQLLKNLSPKKTLKEIEEEVARNTAKYDADTLKGDEKQETKTGMKRVKVNKETAMKNKAAAVGGISNNINPSNVTRLVRMFVIIALGAYKGFYVVQSNMNSRDSAMIQAMEGSSSTTNTMMTTDEFGETIILTPTEQEQSYEQQQQQQYQSKPSRTWAEYIQYKLTAPFESTITAVGISYWFANMLSSGINSRLKAPPKPKGILEQLMSLYQSGFEGVLEYVFCILGEYGLHLSTILLVATVLTLYTEIPTVGNLTPAAVVAAVTENIAKIEL